MSKLYMMLTLYVRGVRATPFGHTVLCVVLFLFSHSARYAFQMHTETIAKPACMRAVKGETPEEQELLLQWAKQQPSLRP